MGEPAIIMTVSILNDDKTCYVCGSPYVERHHIYAGARRKQSEKFGCVVFLCRAHHTGGQGVHFNKALDLKLKQECQRAWEEHYGDREKFRRVFGKSYL